MGNFGLQAYGGRDMAKEWLNIYYAQAGLAPSTQVVEQKTSPVSVGGATIRLLEVDRSGSVVIKQSGFSSYGDGQVYLQISFTDGTPARFFSAPLHTPFELKNVNTLELSIVIAVGPLNTPYVAVVNAHCIYERVE
jgi:hypothetical protein